MKTLNIFAAALLSTTAVSASAATYDFANLKWNSPNNTGFLPSETLNSGYWKCTDGDICSSNVNAGILGGDLKYTSGGITVAATGFYNGNQVSVVQDHENGYNAAKKIGAGLGVYHLTHDNSDDNITTKEKLVMSFLNPVKLEGIALRSDGHNTTQWISNGTFLFNGVNTKLKGSISGLNMVGITFTFEFGGAKPDQFYLSGMTVSAVPEPETYAMMIAGLGLLGFIARRRKQA